MNVAPTWFNGTDADYDTFIRERVARSRSACGVPPHVEDPTVLERIRRAVYSETTDERVAA